MADIALLDSMAKTAQIAAILVGGVWVYFKAIRGRTFIPRLQPKVSAKVIQHRGAQYLLIDMQVQNVGASMARIKARGTSLEVKAMRRFGQKRISLLDDQRDNGFGVFDLNLTKKPAREIEPGTIIYSQEIIEVPIERYDAFRVELRVSALPGSLFGRKDRKWSSWAIALLEPYNKETEERNQGGAE